MCKKYNTPSQGKNRYILLKADGSLKIPYLRMEHCVSRGAFYYHGLTFIPAWISNHMPSEVWDEITYPFSNVNGATVEIWEWISNFIPYSITDVITYPCWDLKLKHGCEMGYWQHGTDRNNDIQMRSFSFWYVPA